MKYLFFDIECSNCFNGVGKMCEFGYVLMDEHFNVIKMDDIPMSPGKGRDNRFYLTGRKHEKDLVLAYEYDYYLTQLEFPTFYNQIKKLMEDQDTVCFAYSMENDIHHLYNACKRYKLKPINYTCYDVQRLVAAYLQKKGQMGLKKACLEIVGPSTVVKLQEHLSRDDAQMEKLIFEAMCIFEKKTPTELLEISTFARANSIDFVDMANKRKEIKKFKSAGHTLYKSLLCDETELDKPENIGRRYCVSGEIKADIDTLKRVINLIQTKNGLFSNHLAKTDYFIVLDEENKEDIFNHLKYPLEAQIIRYDEFISINNKATPS